MTSPTDFQDIHVLIAERDILAADKADLLRVLGVADERIGDLEQNVNDVATINVDLMKRNRELEAALFAVDTDIRCIEGMSGKMSELSPRTVLAVRAALPQTETPVSTLCAICDQIKELHPNTHPWTAKETKGESGG